MEEDAIAVVLEASEAVGFGLYGLDLRVEALEDGVGDGMHELAEQAGQMGLQRERGLLEGVELGASGGAKPLPEERGGVPRVELGPELGEGLLVAPGPGGPEVAFAQFGEAERPFAGGAGALQPLVLGRSRKTPIYTAKGW